MEDEGTVSLWLGTATASGLADAMEVAFSDDGDFLGSPFSRAFGIGYYEESTREAEIVPPSSELAALLTGFSYDTVIAPRFGSLAADPVDEANCVVLLYNVRYDGPKKEWRCPGVVLRFVGAVPYE